MKKYLFLLPAFMLALLLTACVAAEAENPAVTPTPVETAQETPLPTPTATPDPDGAETPVRSFSVYTDWSRLEPYEPREAVYTRRYEEFTDTLIPANDYGVLISFAGAPVTVTEEWDDRISYYDYKLYGLVTLEGEVVVDPVFTGVERVCAYDDRLYCVEELPVYVLTKVFVNGDGEPEERSALCAQDGSWCTGYLYRYDRENSGIFKEGSGLIIAKGSEQLVLVDLTNGREQITIDLALYLDDDTSFNWQLASGGYITVSTYQWKTRRAEFLLFALDGTLLLRLEKDKAHQWVGKYEGGMLTAQGVGSDEGQKKFLYGYMDIEGNWVISPAYAWTENFENGLALVQDRKGSSYFIDRNGVPMTEAILCDHFYSHGDYWYFLDSKERPLAVYDRAGQPVEDFPTVGVGQVSFLEDGWVSVTTAEALIVAKGPQIYRFSADLGKVGSICEEGVLLGEQDWMGRTTSATFVTWEGEVLSYWPDGDDVYLKKDGLAGKSYVTVEFYEEERSECYDLWGTFVAFGENNYSYPSFFGGLLYRAGNGSTTLTSLEGETIFCWPLHSAMD